VTALRIPITERTLSIAAAALAAALAGAPPAAAAGSLCQTGADQAAVQNWLALSASCTSELLRGGSPALCGVPPAPACLGSLAANLTALTDPPALAVAKGPSRDLSALAPQVACQEAIAREARNGIAAAAGLPLQAEGLDGITAACRDVPAVSTPAGTLPRVGAQCGAAIGEPGELVNSPALAGCLATLAGTWETIASGKALRPNIILIVSDDQRWDTLNQKHSLNGSTWVMPKLRTELVNSGVLFSSFFAASPICVPSRSTLLTGQMPHTHGARTNVPPTGGASAFKDGSTLPLWLRAAGYRTGLIGKYLNLYENILLSQGHPYVPPGWDEWDATTSDKYFDYTLVENGLPVYYGTNAADYATDVLKTKALNFITQSAGMGQPFFLYFSVPAPHEPYTPAPRHAGAYAAISAFRPSNYNEGNVTDKPAWVQATPLLTTADQAQIDGWRKGALETLLAVDEAILAVMNQLRGLGIDQNTMVIYTGDHGFLWGEHRLSGKDVEYEETIRAPFVVRYPPLAPLARTETRLASNVDICPTLLELAGAAAGLPQEGFSLRPVIDNTVGTWRTDVLVESYPYGHPWAAVREAQWKYVELSTGEQELYDLNADPLELTSVARTPSNAARVAAMALRVRELRPGWPADTGCTDQDHDGYTTPGNPGFCATLGPDCDDANGQVFDTPGEVTNLLVSKDERTISWYPPASTGSVSGAPTLYDSYRSMSPSSFATAVCIEANDPNDKISVDTAVPAAGQVFYYLVRAQNLCPGGLGSLGTTSNGVPRIANTCP